jgi:hypothetical protein
MPVEDLAVMAGEYVGGLGDIRGMEELVQDFARRTFAEVRVPVRARADLLIQPPYGGDVQQMNVTARAGRAL